MEGKTIGMTTIKELQLRVDHAPLSLAFAMLGLVLASGGLICVSRCLGTELDYPVSVNHISANTTDAPSAQVQWYTDYDKAIARAKRLKRPLLIDFAASWCVPCRLMDRTVWSDESVQKAITNDFVPLRIDMDAKHAPPLIEKFKVEFVPTMLIVDSDEKELAMEGFVSAEELLAVISKLSTASTE